MKQFTQEQIQKAEKIIKRGVEILVESHQYNKSLKNPIEKSTVNCYYNRKKYSQSAGLQGEENECIQIL